MTKKRTWDDQQRQKAKNRRRPLSSSSINNNNFITRTIVRAKRYAAPFGSKSIRVSMATSRPPLPPREGEEEDASA